MQIHIYIYTQHHNDTMNKQTSEDVFRKIYTSQFICKGSKRVTECFTVRGSWRPNRTAIYWPPLLWPSPLCPSRSPGLLNRRPRGPFCWVIYYILSATSLDPNSSGPQWLFRPGLAFPTTPYLLTPSPTAWLLSWLSYIIVQRPLNRLLDLWNGMFDHHQAEITVMQFTGHSLPGHQYHGNFSSSHFVSQFPPKRFPLITAIRMCHFLPVHHLEWHFWPGRRSKYNNRTKLHT